MRKLEAIYLNVATIQKFSPVYDMLYQNLILKFL